MAHQAITGTATLDSPRTRTKLAPLADALDHHPSPDAKDLAQKARQVAAARG